MQRCLTEPNSDEKTFRFCYLVQEHVSMTISLIVSTALEDLTGRNLQ